MIRVIEFNGRSAPVRTTYGTMRVKIAGGEVVVPPGHDGDAGATLAGVERHGRHGGVTCAVIRGFGPRAGALASSVSHDSHNLTVVGTDREDMLAACRALAACGGGIVLVRGGAVVARIELPVAGRLFLCPAEDVAREVAAFRRAAEAAGMVGERPFTGIVSLTLAVSPEAKLSDRGLVGVERQILLPMIVG